jgi:hypothetical protein
MNLYIIGFHSHEESPKIILAHEKEFTQNEFDDLCLGCLHQAIMWLKADSFGGWFSKIYDKIATILVQKHGFSELKYTATFMPWGWGSIFGDDFARDEDLLLKKIRERVKALGFTAEDEPKFSDEDDYFGSIDIELQEIAEDQP